jgi:hypothetical protein
VRGPDRRATVRRRTFAYFTEAANQLRKMGGVYRQRIAPSRLKSTAQAFRASRRSTALRSPRTLIKTTIIVDHTHQNSRESARPSNADFESHRSRCAIGVTALFPRFSSAMDDNTMDHVLSITIRRATTAVGLLHSPYLSESSMQVTVP